MQLSLITKKQKITFYYSNANSEEIGSVARGIPHFISDHFGVKPTYFVPPT